MCEEYQYLLQKAMEDDLSEEEKELFFSHLETCKLCRETYEEWIQIKEELHRLPDQELPTNFHQHLMEQIEHQKPKKGIRGWNKKIGSIAACFIIVGAIFYQMEGIRVSPGQIGDAVRTQDINPSPNSTEHQYAVTTRQTEGVAVEKGEGLVPSKTGECIKWIISTEKALSLKQLTADYLKELKVAYQLTSNQIQIQEGLDHDQLSKWLNQQGGEIVDCELEKKDSSNPILVLEFKVP